MNSQTILSENLANIWNYNSLELLKESRIGGKSNLEQFIEKFDGFAAVNADHSILLSLKRFDLYNVEEKMYALNCEPKDEDFQWGISISSSSKSGDDHFNVFLPNDRNYTGIKLQNDEVEIIIDNKENIKTNISELRHRLHFTKGFTASELEKGFASLSNEKFEIKDDEKAEVKNLLITIPSIGPLIYNDDFEWFEGIFTSDELAFNVNIYNTTPNKLDLLLSFVENHIQNEFYKNMLLEIETEMVKLKNDAWREKNEITTETEAKTTAEDFRKRISIDSIIFNDDCSSQIYCHDDDIFWGHQIQINVDKDGKYKGVDLVG